MFNYQPPEDPEVDLLFNVLGLMALIVIGGIVLIIGLLLIG